MSNKIRILQIDNCFQCFYHDYAFGQGYICKKMCEKTAPGCWNGTPPFCPLSTKEDFLDREIKIRYIEMSDEQRQEEIKRLLEKQPVGIHEK